MQWADRFMWSGEVPATYPGLNPVALLRCDPQSDASTRIYWDAISSRRTWERIGGDWNDIHVPGRRGLEIGLNTAGGDGRVELQHFGGLWPGQSERLLIGLWVRQSYLAAFNPLMDTRATDPFVYLSTTGSTGQPRHQVYSADGELLLDRHETGMPWAQTSGYYYLGMLLDAGEGTSRLFSVHQDGRQWVGPQRTFSGQANTGSTANLDVFSLRHAGYWESGRLDEVTVAHPAAGFDLHAFVDAMSGGTWANGQDPDRAGLLAMDEGGIMATGAVSFTTGAEAFDWDRQPVLAGDASNLTAELSEDGGATWEEHQPDSLPEAFDGLMRWQVDLTIGDSFTGVELTVPEDPPPALHPISDVALEQGELTTITLDWEAVEPVSWEVTTPSLVTVSVEDGQLTIAAGFDTGQWDATVTLTDGIGRRARQSFDIRVDYREWGPGDPPVYPHAPIILWDDDGPDQVLVDPLEATITDEVNGEQFFQFTLPTTHQHARVPQNERCVEVAGERYWIRRITSARTSDGPVFEVYAEARFYELATAGQIDAFELAQTTPARVMQRALAGTGWTVDHVNVSTRRDYEEDNTNPLKLLRTIQSKHGGDLVFDNRNRRVSLVTRSGRDNGVAFFHGRGLTDAKRVVDTSSLVTRIYARNEDGVSIGSVNGGRDYVEDFTWTSEVREATYNFKAGTSPFTMLSTVTATLANRSRPEYSYEATVSDLSELTGDDLDRFAVGDLVTLSDQELGIEDRQRIVRLEYDVIRPWNSEITLSSRLRETGSSSGEQDEDLGTGTDQSTFDLVPFNLLLNSRFDNGLAHWAYHGARVVDGKGTGDHAVRFEGSGQRWIEQTVTPDNRDGYAFSFDLDTSGPAGWSPDLTVQAEITYEDGSTDLIDLELS